MLYSALYHKSISIPARSFFPRLLATFLCSAPVFRPAKMMSSTPARQRGRMSQSRAPSSAARSTPREEAVPEMPPYQPPEAPLTAEHQRQIASLLQSAQFRHIKTHLAHAAEKLTDAAGEANERLCDARKHFERNQERRQQGEGNDEEESEEYRRLGDRETRVNKVTGQLEEKIRMIIDSEARLEGLTNAMSIIEKEEAEAQAAALGARQTRGQRRQQRGDGDEEGEEEDQDYEGTPERDARGQNASNPPSRRLDSSLEEGTDKWNELSLTERYVLYPGFGGMATGITDFGNAGTPATTSTLGSTVWSTTPNIPATRSHPFRRRRHGLRTWKIPMHGERIRQMVQVALRVDGANPRPLTRMILPLNASVFPSNVHSPFYRSGILSPARNARIASRKRPSAI